MLTDSAHVATQKGKQEEDEENGNGGDWRRRWKWRIRVLMSPVQQCSEAGGHLGPLLILPYPYIYRTLRLTQYRNITVILIKFDYNNIISPLSHLCTFCTVDIFCTVRIFAK